MYSFFPLYYPLIISSFIYLSINKTCFSDFKCTIFFGLSILTFETFFNAYKSLLYIIMFTGPSNPYPILIFVFLYIIFFLNVSIFYLSFFYIFIFSTFYLAVDIPSSLLLLFFKLEDLS
jgi:hypothetical protein